MKQIAFLFFTFLGICTCLAQKPAPVNDSITVKQKPFVRLFPNPAKNKVEVEITGFEPGYAQVQLIDKKGNLLRNDKRFVFSGNEVIVLMFYVSPGLYFVLLKQGKNNLRTKLIIQ